MIRIVDLWRSYEMGDQVLHALHDVTLQIQDAEHVAVMGPSGSGKSTLLNILGCLDKPDRGAYYLDGDDVAGLDSDALSGVRRHKIGFVFQAFHLVPRLSAVDNVELPMIFEGIPATARRARAEAALDAVGLGPWMRHRPAELSGGQKQRVAIARATIMSPRILLADEPTGNLDSESGRQVLDLLGELNRNGMTMVVVTHDPNVARRADRVVVLRDGAIAKTTSGGSVTNLASLFADDADAIVGSEPPTS